jgi:hypothetical protein
MSRRVIRYEGEGRHRRPVFDEPLEADLGGNPPGAIERRPTSAISEAQLEQGGLGRMGARTRVEPCACGGVIVAEDDDWAIALEVRSHNQSTRHEHWAIAVGWRPSLLPLADVLTDRLARGKH